MVLPVVKSRTVVLASDERSKWFDFLPGCLRIAEIGISRHAPGVESIESNVPWLKAARRRMKWLIGVSGGADSVALLHLLHDTGFCNLIVCHLHHGLRGQAANGDAAFVKRLAKRLGLQCEIGRVDVAARMNESGESMETAARHARLAFFAEVARRRRCRRLLLAHHADDQAETILWNLVRGAYGLRGMTEEGIISVDGVDLQVMRPLLHLRHADLVDWLRSKRRRWREDASNRLPVAIRNRLRNEALPLLAEITGRDPAEGLAMLATDFAEAETALRDMLENHPVLDPQGRVHLGALRQLPKALQRIAIADFLKSREISGVSRRLIDEVLAMIDPGHPASVNLSGGGRLRRTGGRFWIDW